MGQKNPSRMARWLEKKLGLGSIDESLRETQRKRAGSDEEGDDVVQEVYSNMLDHEKDPDLIRDPSAYVHRVAARVRGRRARDAAEDVVLYDSPIADMAASAAENSEARRVAEDPAEVHLREAEVRDQLARLSWAHRTVYLLHKQYGYSRAEIAVWLGVHESKVRRYLVEANRTLRDLAPRRPKPRALRREPGKG